MRQSKQSKGQARGRMIGLVCFCALLSLPFLYPRASSNGATLVQQRRRAPQTPQRRRAPRARQPQGTKTSAASGATARNYSRFKHEDHRLPVAKLDCADCHTISSPLEPDLVAAATKPSAAGYPYHDSCVRCHRQQFFKGASPAICSVCHTRSSPRLAARDMLKFPKQDEQQIAREFPGYFPHSTHQSVIARQKSVPPSQQALTNWSFARASFRAVEDAPPRLPENCATCHLTDEREPVAIAVGGTETAFKPEVKGTFKTVPSGHASCFNCHWQSQKPVKDDCAGCHLSQDEYTKKKRAASLQAQLPGLLSPKAAEWFKTWPRDWPKRLSIKFRHDTANHNIGCTSCHINLMQMETLNIPKADVPIATCAPCHISTSPVLRREGGNLTIFSEMTAEAKDTENRTNTCIGCHTSVIGRERPPCSHYLVLGQQCR